MKQDSGVNWGKNESQVELSGGMRVLKGDERRGRVEREQKGEQGEVVERRRQGETEETWYGRLLGNNSWSLKATEGRAGLTPLFFSDSHCLNTSKLPLLSSAFVPASFSPCLFSAHFHFVRQRAAKCDSKGMTLKAASWIEPAKLQCTWAPNLMNTWLLISPCDTTTYSTSHPCPFSVFFALPLCTLPSYRSVCLLRSNISSFLQCCQRHYLPCTHPYWSLSIPLSQQIKNLIHHQRITILQYGPATYILWHFYSQGCILQFCF